MNKELIMRINWPFIIIFIIFWSYGYHGAIAVNSIFIQLLISSYLIGITIYLLYVGSHKKEIFTFKFAFLIKDIFILLLMLSFWIAIGFDKLSQPIVDDHFFYSLVSKLHEITAIKILNNYLNLENIVFKNIIYWLDLFIIISVGILIGLSRLIKFSFISKSILICITLIIFRYFIISQGGGNNPHPPFQLFPLWLSTSIFGLSDLTLRIPQYIGLIGCSFFIYLSTLKRFGRVNSFFISSALCSIPIFIHVATLVEASIWTSILWIILLIQIPSNKKQKPIYWICISSLISIFVLLRLTSFIAYPIFLMLFMRYHWSISKDNIQTFAYVVSPFLLCLPFLLTSIILGTPAAYTPGEAEFILNDHTTFHRITYALSHGIVLETALNSINVYYLMLLLGIFLKFKSEKNYFFNRFLIIIFLIAATAMFFSIRPILWGIDRYKAEYIVPFIVLGSYLIFSKIQTMPKSNVLIPIISSILLYFGVTGFQNYPNNNINKTDDNRFSRWSEKIYDYKSALIASRQAGFANNTLLVGVTYGMMPQILSGYTIDEVEKSDQILKKHTLDQNLKLYSAEAINNQLDINLVLISDGKNIESLRDNLLLLGWSDWKQFASESNNVIYGLIRDNKP
jgi:hypothetical protein